MIVHLFVNDRPYTWDVRPDEMLAHTLRDHEFTSVKTGCDMASCGVCTVWVEGKPVLSCSVLSARMEGKHVTTIEGVAEEAEAFGRFLVAEGVDQCGYCSPGFVLLVLAMKRELHNPTREQVKQYLNGNLCRCSGYQGKLRAIEKFMHVQDA